MNTINRHKNDSATANTMPCNERAEKTILVAMTVCNDYIVEVEKEISSSDFYFEVNSVIYDSIVTLYSQQKAVDPITVEEQLKNISNFEGFSFANYFDGCFDYILDFKNIVEYVEIVKNKSLLRKVIHVTNDIQQMCFLEKESLNYILNFTEEKIFNVTKKIEKKEFRHIKGLLEKSVEKIEEISRKEERIVGIPSGFHELDKITLGFQKGDLILVAARPAMGKTSFVLNIAEYASVFSGASIGIFSLEMPAIQIVTRMISFETEIDSYRLRSGELLECDWQKMAIALETLSKSNIYIDDTAGIGVAEVFSKCKKLKTDVGLDLIIIDYLQLMSSGVNKRDNRQQEISDISRSMKALALNLDVPIVLLSQLSRAPEARTDHRPILSDLRESGAIEQDADIVMFLYRDDYYNKESEERGIAECIIAKHRNGELGTIKLNWYGEFTKFAN